MALDFERDDDSFLTTLLTLSPVASGSLSYWCKPESTSVNANIFGMDIGPYHVLHNGTGILNRIFQNLSVATAAAIVAGVWQHIVMTWTPSGGDTLIQVWRNATLLQTATLTTTTPAAQKFSIGNRSFRPVSQQSFDGLLDDVRIYNRVLADAEIETMFAVRGIDGIVDGRVNRWTMAEGTGKISPSAQNTIGATTQVEGAVIETAVYTVPSGLVNPVLIVTAGAEDDAILGNTEPDTASFGGTGMTKVSGVIVGSGGVEVGVGMFRLAVSPGDSGVISVVFMGSVPERWIAAMVVDNIEDAAPEALETAINGSGNTTDSITTITDGAFIVGTACQGLPQNLSALGFSDADRHQISLGVVPGSLAGAISQLATLGSSHTYSGIGFNASSVNRMVQILAAFKPLPLVQEVVKDLTGNLNATPLNGPVYGDSELRRRRRVG